MIFRQTLADEAACRLYDIAPNESSFETPMNEHLQRAEPKPLFDPLSPEFIRDPYPFYERLRMTDPMHLTPLGAYVASRHADVSLILRDKRFGKNFVERMTRRYGPQVMQEPVYRCMRHWRRSRKNIAKLHEGRS